MSSLRFASTVSLSAANLRYAVAPPAKAILCSDKCEDAPIKPQESTVAEIIADVSEY